jgi:anaerobic magnesium-protoporphyrin IX monomethyl ester cyclase
MTRPTKPALTKTAADARHQGRRLARGDEIKMNLTRPFIKDLNDLPIPMHDLLPWEKYRMP